MLAIFEIKLQLQFFHSFIHSFKPESQEKLSSICYIMSENKRDNGHPETRVVLELPAVRSVLSSGPHRHLDEPQ